MASNAAQFAALDNTSFNRFHLKTILVSGIGFFTDALDIFVINLAIPMISYVWWPHLDAHKPSKVGGMPAIIMSLLKASTQMGTFMGQIVFGYLGDKLGRKATYGIVLGIIIGATINTALASDTKGSIGIGAMLILWRIILGIGIGGDYPISAVIASEFASVSTRGLMVAAVFSMQGLGILAGALLCIVSLAIFKPTLETTPDSLYNPNFDNVWRLLLFLGIVPAIVAVYWRLQVPETPRFTAAVGGDAELAMKDVNKVVGQMGGNSADIEAVAGSSSTVVHTTTTLDPSQHGYLQEKYAHLTFTQVFGNWKNGKMLFATAAAWCLLDIGFYGVQLNQSSILTQLGYGTGDTAFDYFWSVAVGNLVVTLCGAAPGYFFTVFTIEKLGRKVIQIGGFAILSVIFVIMTIFWDSLKGTTGFFVLYVAANFFFNYGPNSTTFIIPAELFPTRFRSTCHGLSAAAGKAGAIAAAFGFDQMRGANNEHMVTVLAIFSVCMIAGTAVSFLLPETKGKTLEELGDLFYSEEVVSKFDAAPGYVGEKNQ